MLTPPKGFCSADHGKGASIAGPLALHPSPARRGTLSERKATQFQDHLVLETILDFRIILGLENAEVVRGKSHNL
jgi:hypothetical protein